MSDEGLLDEPVQLFRGKHLMARPVSYDRGSVQVDGTQLRLLKNAEVVASAPLDQVRYWRPRLFAGTGVKVHVGGDGDWTVAPAKNGLFALGHARRWVSAFVKCLTEGGARET